MNRIGFKTKLRALVLAIGIFFSQIAGRNAKGRFADYPQVPPPDALQKLKEDYAEGKLTYAQLCFSIDRYLYRESGGEPPPALPEVPESIPLPPPKDKYAALRQRLLEDVQDYQRRNQA